MVSLRCWSTTPDERGRTIKIPDQPRFLGEITFRDTRRLLNKGSTVDASWS